MANAKKCDVCKKFYEAPICNDVVRLYMDFGYIGAKDVDLCDDCYDKLCDFIKPALPKDHSVERRR